MDSVSSVLMLISYSRDRFSVAFYSYSSLFCCRRSSMSAEKSDSFCRNSDEDIDILIIIDLYQYSPTLPSAI